MISRSLDNICHRKLLKMRIPYRDYIKQFTRTVIKSDEASRGPSATAEPLIQACRGEAANVCQRLCVTCRYCWTLRRESCCGWWARDWRRSWLTVSTCQSSFTSTTPARRTGCTSSTRCCTFNSSTTTTCYGVSRPTSSWRSANSRGDRYCFRNSRRSSRTPPGSCRSTVVSANCDVSSRTSDPIRR